MKKVKSIDKIKIGNFLLQLRKEKGISQGQLGIMLGVTNKAVSKWENGDNEPEISMLYKISDLYRVSVDEIVQGERNKDVDPIKEKIEKEILLRRLKEVENQQRRKARYYFIVKLFLLSVVSLYFLFAFITFNGLLNFDQNNNILNFIIGLITYLSIPLLLAALVSGFELIEKILPSINPAITIVALTVLPLTLSIFEVLGLIFIIRLLIQEKRIAYPKDEVIKKEDMLFLYKVLFFFLGGFMICSITSIIYHIFGNNQFIISGNFILLIILFLYIATITIIFGYQARKRDLI